VPLCYYIACLHISTTTDYTGWHFHRWRLLRILVLQMYCNSCSTIATVKVSYSTVQYPFLKIAQNANTLLPDCVIISQLLSKYCNSIHEWWFHRKKFQNVIYGWFDYMTFLFLWHDDTISRTGKRLTWCCDSGRFSDTPYWVLLTLVAVFMGCALGWVMLARSGCLAWPWGCCNSAMVIINLCSLYSSWICGK